MEIKECPFCHSTDSVEDRGWTICQKCDATASTEAWNTRSTPARLLPLNKKVFYDWLITEGYDYYKYGWDVFSEKVCAKFGSASVSENDIKSAIKAYREKRQGFVCDCQLIPEDEEEFDGELARVIKAKLGGK